LQKTNDSNCFELSLYSGGILTDTNIAVQLKKLQTAFPRQPAEFFNVLAERIVANGFTNERLNEAVNKVIDNFQYRELNVSDITRFDKKVKLYTYGGYCDLISRSLAVHEDFDTKQIDGKYYWFLKKDLHQ
jgi:hypothetical protein